MGTGGEGGGWRVEIWRGVEKFENSEEQNTIITTTPRATTFVCISGTSPSGIGISLAYVAVLRFF